MDLISLRVAARQFVRALAPDGTWRGTARQAVADLLRNPAVRESGPEPLPIYDREALALRLPGGGQRLLNGDPAQAEVDAFGAARFVLSLVRDRADLRRRFPRALSDGTAGPFCRWLCVEGAAGYALSARAVCHIREAFGRGLGAAVRRLYAGRPELRRLFPLGLTPGGRRRFLHWLLHAGVRRHGLRPEEAWWFVYESAEDSGAALALSYRLNPRWQRAVPDGLTARGQPALRAWVRDRYRVRSAWLDAATFPPEPAPAPGALGVNVLGHFCYPSGLQEQALAAARAARAAGVGAALRDVPAGRGLDALERTPFLDLEAFDVTLFYFGSEPSVSAGYELAGLAARPDAYRVVARSWELEAVPRSWARAARAADEFWAHTRFIADAMRPVLPIPVVHMLPGVELAPFTPLPRSHFGLPEDRLLFLFVFDMNSVMERKNPLGLVRAFRQAFGPGDRASLVLKVSRGSADPAGLRRLAAAAGEAGVRLIDRVMSREESLALMACCDCYASLHRSEGFGFTMAEAMLLGKPVVATAYSGNLDFMTPTNSLPVGYRRVPLDRGISVYPKGSFWAEPDEGEAAARLRWVYDNREAARRLGETARAEAGRLLSFRAAGERMLDRLRAIRAARAGKAGRPRGGEA